MKLNWKKVCSKIFNLKLVRYFQSTTGHPELAISAACMMIVCEVNMFLLAVFLLLTISVFWRTVITNFFHCLFAHGEKSCPKT